MSVFRIILYIAIFIASFSIGTLISKKYSSRVQELKKMKNALNICKTKMKFTYQPIPEIFEDIANSTDGNVKRIFEEACKQIQETSAGEAWKQAIQNMESNFTREDKEILKSFSKLLGKTSIEGQLSEIELTSEFLDTQIRKAELERNKNEKLYKTLGLVGGLGLVIILM